MSKIIDYNFTRECQFCSKIASGDTEVFRDWHIVNIPNQVSGETKERAICRDCQIIILSILKKYGIKPSQP